MSEQPGAELAGAVAVVTGASRGIGRAVAVALAREGAEVVGVARDAAALDELRAAIGGSSHSCDLREPGAADRVVEHVLSSHGRVDVLVANAGAGWLGPVAAMPPGAIADLVALNVTAPLELARACLPDMLDRGSGRLLFVTSIAGALGVPGETAYSATKAAVELFADTLREELHGTGVRISTLLPGVVDTAFFEARGAAYDRAFPRPIPVERVADAAVDLLRGRGRSAVRPRWLAAPIRIRALAPRAYRLLERRFG